VSSAFRTVHRFREFLLGVGVILALLVGWFSAGCGPGRQGSRELAVYSAEKEEIILAVSEMWAKAEPSIRMNNIAAGTQEIVQRVLSEKRHPLGDVVWGIGAEGPSALPQLFEPYETQERKAVDARWSQMVKGEPWQPNNIVPMCLIYNTKLVEAKDAPRSWRDLADARWKGRLAYAAPDKSGSAYTQLATMVAVFGDNGAGWKMIGRIMANAKILPSSGKVPKGVADGEYALGVTYENVANLYVLGKAPVKIVYPVEGTAILPDANALIRGCPHPKEARRFLDFVQGKAVQEMLARKLSLRSCRTDVSDPPGLPPVDSIKAAPAFNFRWSVQHRKEFIEKWQELVLGLQQ